MTTQNFKDKAVIITGASSGIGRALALQLAAEGAWLAVLHAERAHSHYTALYSNITRAHEPGTTRDWVLIYPDDHTGAGQGTVVTARHGRLKGKRMVHGREAECKTYCATLAQPSDQPPPAVSST